MLNCIRSCIGETPLGAALLGLLAVVLPSLITALTASGRGKAGTLALLLRVLDRASVLTHADARGTLKLPIKASVPHDAPR